jgi:hypothetical protein
MNMSTEPNIIEDLRWWAANPVDGGPSSLLEMAADEIERLRAVIGSVQRSAFDAGFDAGRDSATSDEWGSYNPSRLERYKMWANTP